MEAAAEVADYAKPLGVKCIYEDQGLFANGVDGFGAFYKQMKQRCSNVGVCGDMGNSLFVDEGAERFFAAYAEDICHVHVKDYMIRTFAEAPSRNWYPTKGGRWLRETMVGDGNVDVASCMDILHMTLLRICFPETSICDKSHNITSVQFSCSVVSNSLRLHGLQHTKPLCPSPVPGVYSDSCPLSQ